MSNLTLEIGFIKKYPSGGRAFEGEFDFADFVVKNTPEYELPYKQVDDAFYHWQPDVSL